MKKQRLGVLYRKNGFHLIRPPRLEKKTKKAERDVLNKFGQKKKRINVLGDIVDFIKRKKEILIKNMIHNLEDEGILRKKMISKAIGFVDRIDFVPEELKDRAHDDEPLPIGLGQTISQPSTVSFMLELLDVRVGSHVMDVGAGSCWQTTLLAYLVGSPGHVYAYEIIPELCEFGYENLSRYPNLLRRVSLFCYDAKKGMQEGQTNYLDRIIVSADVSIVPQIWREQLVEGGVIVYASGTKIIKEVKVENNVFNKEEYEGFSFVPLV